MMRFMVTIALTLWGAIAHAEIEIQEITSLGGINAWLVEEHSIPFVSLEIRIVGGASLDRPGKRGAINLMTGLLEEGSGDLDARGFQATREALAASFGYNVHDDTFTLSFQALTENRDEALELFRQSIINPTFGDVAIERVRAQVIAGIESDAQRPNSIAGNTFFAAAFPDHPYGADMSGTLESVAALTREDLINAHADVLTRDRIYVAAVGDITADELGAMIDDLLGELPTGSPELPGDIDFALTGGITVVEYPTPQSVAIFGQPGIERDDEDFFAAYILNHILGGGSFESRLMEEVREKRGLTYGIGTYLIPKDHAELILGSVSSANDRVAEAIDVIRSEWARMATDGVTERELQDAKTYLTGEYPLRFDGNGQIAGIMVGMQVQGLPVEYVINRNDYINAVTMEEINRVAAELLDAEALHFVVVGQPVGLETTE